MNIPLLTQAAEPAASLALTSTAVILSATFVIVALLKRLLPTLIVGRGTLLAALVISLGLTALAMFGTKTLPADLSGFLAVLIGLTGAAGIDASGRAVLGGGKPPALLVPLGLSLVVLAGCNGVPTPIVDGHLNTAGADHLARVRAAAEDPPRVIPASPLQLETWEDHYDAMGAAVEASR